VIKKRKSFFGIKPLGPVELRKVVTMLGASFIKLAQVLATRADFFDEYYLVELRKLHDSLDPMDEKSFKEVFSRSLSEDSFLSFEKIPVASASIGQVHRATLHTNEKVAVKLRRLDIDKQVKADIRIISYFNTLFKPLFSHTTKNSIEAIIKEFTVMILEEVSLNQELRNLQKFSQVYESSGILFPLPFPALCSDDALVMSYEEGFRFDDKENIYKNNIDFKSIINKLVDFYTTQMLVNGYFHADPHPGNLLVTKEGEIILLDFGMVKRVPNQTRIAIIELLQSANEKDYERYIAASKKLGTIAYEAPVGELAEFTEKMFEIFSNENLNSESMQKLAFDVLDATRDLPFKLPSDAIYILRVSAIIEGLGTTYIENFNGIKDILPILQQNIPRALGAKESIAKTIISEIKDIPFIAKDFKSALKKISSDELRVEISKDQLDWILREIFTKLRSISFSFMLLFLGFFITFYDESFKELGAILVILAFIYFYYKKS
jgi:predicted unusual protein kinase regulating ubiquinone biosynthesis (AarF/ABC1/UbiB family)